MGHQVVSRGAMALVVAPFLAPVYAADPIEKGDVLTVSYGVVDRVDPVRVGEDGKPTGVAAGAVVGGLAGAANASSAHSARDAAAGAAVGGLLTSAFQHYHNKDNAAFQYTVDMLDKTVISVVVEHGDIEAGDCVSVERGSSANIRRVPSVHCENPASTTMKSEDIARKQMNEALDCQKAKNTALAAKTETEIDVAVKKVRVFCEG
jgi:outer membrane lipoprotein SlyB